MPDWDLALVRAARGRGALDLALGETLLHLFAGDRLVRLGYSRQSDYARERLGVAARTMFQWTRLASGLANRPLLRRAVVAGAVSTRKALTVLGVASGEREADWTAAAMHLPLGELEHRVRGEGHDPSNDTFEVESIVLRMTPKQQDRLDAALELAGEVEGPGSPRWQRLEAICQEWLGANGEWEASYPLRPRTCAMGVTQPQLERCLELPEGRDGILGPDGPDGPIGRIGDLPDDAAALDARARDLLRRRQAREEELGRRLEPVLRGKLYRELGFQNFAVYCRDRLGISPRTARQRIWLERQMCALPALREALAAGRISVLKARLIARHATPYDVESRIEEAASTTHQQQERDATAEEDRQNRATGVRRLWGPTDAAETVVGAIAAFQVKSGERRGFIPTAGGALAGIADHFVEVWTRHRKPASKRRREVLGRHGGLCAVPGCSRAAEHVHHIVYRSRGGSHDIQNLVGLCAVHHLRGVHRGFLSVEGNADERLIWRFAEEVWITDAAGDTRRTA